MPKTNRGGWKTCSRGHKYRGPGPCPVCNPGAKKGSKKRWAIATVILSTVAASSPAPRANFLVIEVSSPQPARVRATWRPLAGARTFEEQQAAIHARRAVATPDSVRRYQDQNARDTSVVSLPAAFVVDMTGGPATFEAVGADSVKVVAQLTPRRGPVAIAWGKSLVVEADGIAPSITRRP